MGKGLINAPSEAGLLSMDRQLTDQDHSPIMYYSFASLAARLGSSYRRASRGKPQPSRSSTLSNGTSSPTTNATVLTQSGSVLLIDQTAPFRRSPTVVT